MREEHRRRGQAAFVGVKMVLRNPGAVETVFFGVDDLFSCEAIPLAGRHVVEKAGEKAQAFFGNGVCHDNGPAEKACREMSACGNLAPGMASISSRV